MSKRTTPTSEAVSTQGPETTPDVAENPFRAEAEANMAKMDRLRLEHIAQERGVTVAQLLEADGAQAPTKPAGDSPRKKAVTGVLEAVEHVKESIRESEKHARH